MASYLVLICGVIGVALGLYGLMLPTLRSRGLTIPLPKLAMPRLFQDRTRQDSVESLVAELERTGFRNSGFAPAPDLEEAETIGEAEAFAVPERPAVMKAPVGAAPANLDDEELDPELEALVEAVEAEEIVIPDLDEDEAAVEPETVVIEASVEGEAPEEPQAEEPKKAKSDDPFDMTGDLMSMFGEAEVAATAPSALKDSLPKVTIEELLEDARSVRKRLRPPAA